MHVKAFTGESAFYNGAELRDHLRDLIVSSTSVDIATAWVSDAPAVKLLLSEGVKAAVRIVVGIGGYNTDPVALKRLGTHPNVTLKIYGKAEPPLFHPKLYLFRHAHWRRVLIGSMNLTNAGATANTESMLSFDDKLRRADQEFERFWNAPSAVPFSQFDIADYEAKRRAVLAAVKEAGAADVLDADVAESAESKIEMDALREDWNTYVSELKRNPDGLEDHLRVLRVRQGFVSRDWSQDLTEDELAILYGKSPYYAFGRLNPVKQAQFQGPEGRSRRRELGAALQSAATLQGFQGPLVAGLVRRLLAVHTVGPALATRLLILARPDLFVVVNKKSFQGLRERFDLFVSNENFDPAEYVKLLQKIHTTGWYQSTEPSETFEREIWQARAAMVDPLVYRENAGSENDD